MTVNPVSCEHTHSLVKAAPGELVADDSPRLWEAAVPVRACEYLAYPNGSQLTIEAGTPLRYEQRDYGSSWRHQSWDRFLVLDGPLRGFCVAPSAQLPEMPETCTELTNLLSR